jgi:uncharacterized protein (DUF433 family)
MKVPDFLTEDADGFIHVTGHRIGLMHLIYYYNQGFSPAMLFDDYPTLSLDLIQNIIAFYQENKVEVDAYVARCQAEMEEQRARAPKGPSREELRRRLEAKRPAESAH